MKMTPEQIEEIISANPDLTYQEVKKQAITAGVSLNDFNEAWHAYLLKTRKPPASKTWEKVYIVALIILSILGLETAYWHFLISLPNEVFAGNVGKFALFTSMILVLHLSSRFAGSRVSIFSTTKLPV